MDSSEFNKYQKLASATFKVHAPLDAWQAGLLDWSLGLCGECGELVEKIKHHLYHDAPLDTMGMAKELGDVLWYVSAISKTLRIDLNDVADLNLAKLSHRYDHGGFDPSLSAVRHQREKCFSDTLAYAALENRILGKIGGCNVVLIGPDGSGKTSIASTLSALLGFDYYKGTYREQDKLLLATELILSRQNTVFDRFYYPDEVIYRKIKGDPLTPEQEEAFDTLEPLMVAKDFLLIYVSADKETLQSRLSKRGDDFVDPSHIDSICEEYEKFLAKTHCPLMRIQTDDVTTEKAVVNIMRWLREQT